MRHALLIFALASCAGESGTPTDQEPRDTTPCDPSPCDPNATCHASGASHTCTCDEGYTGNGETCALAQPIACDTDCDEVYTSSAIKDWGDADMSDKKVCLTGNVTYANFKNLRGTPGHPAVMINCDGVATITRDGNTGLWGFGFENVRFTGTGDPSHEHGIVVTITGSGLGLDFTSGSTDLEIDHVNVTRSGGQGIVVRTYPTCVDGALAYTRPGFSLDNVFVHHNLVENAGGEGFYIGPSHHQKPEGHFTLDCDDDGTNDPNPEADANNIWVYANVVTNSGKDGIQVGAAVGGAEIFDNVVTNWAQSETAGVDNKGIELNPGTLARVYRNRLTTSTPCLGPALSVQGAGGSVIFNNVFEGAYRSVWFLRNTGPSATPHRLYNNTIINAPQGDCAEEAAEDAQDYALRAWCTAADNTAAMSVEVKNNIVVGYRREADATKVMQCKAGCTSAPNHCWTHENNLFVLASEVSTLLFNDADTGDYGLSSAESPAVDAGLDLSDYVTDDFAKNPRTTPFDIGAFEL